MEMAVGMGKFSSKLQDNFWLRSLAWTREDRGELRELINLSEC